MFTDPLGGRRYQEIVLSTRPVFYVPGMASTCTELVQKRKGTIAGSNIRPGAQPFGDMHAIQSIGTQSRIDIPTHTSYHPGDTFSVMVWFNRTGAGDADPCIVHLDSNDFTVYFSGSSPNEKLTLRKATVADVITGTTNFSSFPTGWFCGIFTKNGGSAGDLQVNGVDEGATFSNQTIVASSSPVGLMNQSGGTANDYTGYAAHIAIWNRVLTTGERRMLYQAGRNAI